MAGKDPNTWLGSLQLTPCLVTCHTPSIVGVWFSPGSLHTNKVLATTARVINAICVLRFIFSPLVTGLSVLPSLLLVIEVSVSCRSVSRHYLKDGFSAKGDGNLSDSFPMVEE
jgi:hypothetical protein